MVKLQAFDSSNLCGKSHFEDDDTQNFLLFQLVYKYFKKSPNINHILTRKSKGLSDKNIKPPSASNATLVLTLNHISTKLQLKFDGHCFKNDKVTFTNKHVVDIYTAYKVNL